ncbi:MAG: Rrf2 family transcriptional regulator [Deltaproteobacteria bacterium]|nr:Rrf2 family transcriptional regulator [Deltaproteobacteria bacterium]
MKIKRETDHALKCVLHLAQHQDEYINVLEISQQKNIPRTFLAKILQKLTKAGIVESHQGSHGGFKLTRQPAEISIYEIYKVVQGGIEVNKCVIDNKFCDRIHYCSIHPVWIEVQVDIKKKLINTSFADLISKEAVLADGVQRKKAKT